jgi:hypothetical protein
MPWWNDELANLRQRMRQAYKKWQYNRNNAGTSTFLINAARMLFKAEAAKFQRLIRTQKKETWKSFCTNDMNNDLQTSLRYLARKETCSSNPSSLLVEGDIIKSPVDIAKAFASHFFKPSLPSSDCHTSITKKNDDVLSHPTCHTPPITMYELESAISTLKPTNSAGIDQLSSSLILATHPCYDHTLLEILNVSLSNGWFPSPWNIAKITIIQKPNKSNYELLESYRPISVLPTFAKIFERIILSRLKWIAAEGSWFNPGQHGFREGCSTETAAHDLVHHIETHFSNKEFIASAFVDIKAAFDSAWHPAIIAALLKKNCPLYLVRIIGDYLANGKPQIDIDGHLIETDISTGCPQGGILSAFLRITLIDDVFNIFLPFPVFISAYADDLTIACSHSDPTLATSRLNIACYAVVDWLFSIKLLINPPKTIFMIFDFRRSNRLLPTNLSLTLQGTTL